MAESSAGGGSQAWANPSPATDKALPPHPVQAVGGGGVVPVAMAIVVDEVPPSRRALGLGAIAAASEAGALLGPLWGGLITDLADSAGRIIAASVTKLAHDLGRNVIAEGIETEAQHKVLMSLGCERAQGYLYGRPMPAIAIEALLTRRSKPAKSPLHRTSYRSWLSETSNR